MSAAIDLQELAAALAPLIAEQTQPSPLLDAEQAGKLLNVKASWVLAQARKDAIPHVRLGHYPRFERDELEAWWRARARGPRRAAR